MYEFSWPREKADFKFIGKENNCIIENMNSENLEKEFYKYSLNFNIAGNIIIDYIIPLRNNGIKDSWFFPIVYLYRQSLELILKTIAFKYIINKQERSEYLREVGHNLSRLLETVYRTIQLSNVNIHEELLWLKEYLNDITYVDRESDVFRYPFSNNGINFFKEQKNINLCYLKTNMNTAYQIIRDIYEEVDTATKQYSAHKPIFLINGGDYLEQSVIGWHMSLNNFNFYPYINGYTETANYLRDLIVKDTIKWRKMFLPMCYLYRNSVELSLKRILIEDINLDYERAMRKISRKKHSVLGIWNDIKLGIEECSPSNEDKTIINAEKYIIKLQDIDSSSTKFRYPVDKNLNYHFKENEKFDVKNVALCFNELLSFLDGVNSELSVRREWEAEMRNYYDNYY